MPHVRVVVHCRAARVPGGEACGIRVCGTRGTVDGAVVATAGEQRLRSGDLGGPPTMSEAVRVEVPPSCP